MRNTAVSRLIVLDEDTARSGVLELEVCRSHGDESGHKHGSNEAHRGETGSSAQEGSSRVGSWVDTKRERLQVAFNGTQR